LVPYSLLKLPEVIESMLGKFGNLIIDLAFKIVIISIEANTTINLDL
jgi:hypothetical protein